jgi:hypothetical protein
MVSLRLWDRDDLALLNCKDPYRLFLGLLEVLISLFVPASSRNEAEDGRNKADQSGGADSASKNDDL